MLHSASAIHIITIYFSICLIVDNFNFFAQKAFKEWNDWDDDDSPQVALAGFGLPSEKCQVPRNKSFGIAEWASSKLKNIIELFYFFAQISPVFHVGFEEKFFHLS